MTAPASTDALARLLTTAADAGLDVDWALVHGDLAAAPAETPTIRTPRGLVALQAVGDDVVAEQVVRLRSSTPQFAGGPPFVLQSDPGEPASVVLGRLLDATRLPGYPEGSRDVRLDGTFSLAFAGVGNDVVTADRQAALRRLAEEARHEPGWTVDVHEPSPRWRTARVEVAAGTRFVVLFEDNDELCHLSDDVTQATPVPGDDVADLLAFTRRVLAGPSRR